MAVQEFSKEPVILPAHVLSMTNEERDIDDFRVYLETLPPESLYDIVGHLDEERYPLRVDTVHREIERRRLFFISPYTAFECKLRIMFGISVAVAVFAAALRAIGNFDVQIEPGEHLCWFIDIAIGGPPAARMILPLALFLAEIGAVATAIGACLSIWSYIRHKLRADVLVMGMVAVVLISLFVRLAGYSSL